MVNEFILYLNKDVFPTLEYSVIINDVYQKEICDERVSKYVCKGKEKEFIIQIEVKDSWKIETKLEMLLKFLFTVDLEFGCTMEESNLPLYV